MKTFKAMVRMLSAGALMLIVGAAAAQEAYPNRAIHFITPFAPGGSTTTVAHLVGEKLTEHWGQPVIVENRPGGNMIIGTDALAKSPPDGYTIMLTSNSHIIMFQSLPYDPIKDFAPVATAYGAEFLMVINAALSANNLQEFIALAKSKPGQLNYGSTGTGGSGHLAMAMFCTLAGVNMQHIPYKGAGPAMIDLMGGQIQMHTNNPLVMIPHIKSGKVKAMAITGERRLAALPQVPTFTEAGLPGLDVKVWFGVLAPAATPKPIIDKLAAEIARIVTLPDIKEKLLSQGLQPIVTTPEQFAALMKADMAKYAKIIKTANIKMVN